jgi:hypothetical protein
MTEYDEQHMLPSSSMEGPSCMERSFQKVWKSHKNALLVLVINAG